MNKIWWRVLGKGNIHLVLLHGWGLNADVWNCISAELSSYFTLHIPDLPGFGRSCFFDFISLERISKYLLQNAPDKAVWIGWSLGGLIASQVALFHPERVHSLVTVSSSPCFIEKKGWPGINLQLFSSFQRNLKINVQKTVERFLMLQVLGTQTVQKDFRILKEVLLQAPIPNVRILSSSLEILKNVDLRESLFGLTIPCLRIYGYFDKLVSYKTAPILKKSYPRSKSLLIRNASHVPFISHGKEFCNAVISFAVSTRNER